MVTMIVIKEDYEMVAVNKMTKTILAVVTVLGLGACGTSDDLSTVNDASKGDASVEPGEFRLYTEKDPEINPECDVFTDLKLVNGIVAPVAILENKLEGSCKMLVHPDHREFTLEVIDAGCGSKVLVEDFNVAEGAAEGIIRRIEIIDHRDRVCKDAVDGQLIVKEHYGHSTVTRYAQF